MNRKLASRAAALAASLLITLVLFQSVALLGLPASGRTAAVASAPARVPSGVRAAAPWRVAACGSASGAACKP